MKVDEIEVHTGTVEFHYTPIRQLEAKCEATTLLNAAPTIADANNKLREMAVGVGANAVINVQYHSGMSLTSWKSITATGLAVRRESDDMACPVCAETVKRAAKQCRFCGAALPSASPPQEANHSAPTTLMRQEPLRSWDNKAAFWIILVVTVIAVLSILASLT